MWKDRLKVFTDPSAWLMLAVSALPIWLLDSALFLTLLQWSVFSFAIGSVTVVIRRMMVPWLDLPEYLERTKNGELASSIVVLGVMVLTSSLFLGITLWASN